MARPVVAEGVATGLLLAGVVGSGIMAERLAGGNGAVALLANALATGALLLALILSFGPLSGAHLNPLVTAMEWWGGKMSGGQALGYVAAQVVGAVGGVVLAEVMFEAPVLAWSGQGRSGWGQWTGEVVASFGLLSVIRGTSGREAGGTPVAVAAYIVGAFWFTSSTSFANPAATLARSLTDSYAGIAPGDILGFVAAQLAGAALAIIFWREA
ncbi:MAG: aquaporin [Acidobacteriota bacterium]